MKFFMNIARWWREWIVGKQHHFPRKMSLLNLFDRTLFLFRVGTNPPEPLNSPNLDGEPLSSYAGNFRTFKIKMTENIFIKYAQYFQKTIVTLPIVTLTTRSRAEAGKFSGSAASPDSRLRLVNFSLLFPRPLIKSWRVP